MSQTTVRFGPFALDTRAGELSRGGRRVLLQEKPLRLLLALVERPQQIVTRAELRERLWPANIVVEFDSGVNNAVNKLRHVLGDSAGTPKYIETVGRRGYRFIGTMTGDSAMRQPDLVSPVPRMRSLAVLPLENLSDDAEQEYFSDGMTDALISRLGGICSMRIISRQSVMRYKRSALPMPAIARELGVDGAIEGTVLKADRRVRISVQLVHAPSDRHLWSAQYERPLDDVIELQSEIAGAVAAEVRATVTAQEAVRLEKREQVHPEAYDLYLRGRHFWALRTEAGLRRSLDYYRRSIEIEPRFARAHAALAESYGPLGYGGNMSPGEATPNMRAAAVQALALDPELVEGLAVRGACAAFHEWKWNEGEQFFRRALEVSSNYAMAFGWYGLLLENTGRQAENLQARQRAFELNPLWIATGLALGSALFLNGRAEEAISVVERTLELDPDNPMGLACVGRLYEATGRVEQAIAAFARAGDNGDLAHAYADAGRRQEARQALARLEERARTRYVAPHQFALAHVGLGDAARALDALELGFALRDPGMSCIKVDPRYEPLAGQPRYVALLQRMGLR